MKINLYNNRVNFGAIRVSTDLPTKASKKAENACKYIFENYSFSGIFGPDYNAFFFSNKQDEVWAEKYLLYNGVSYERNDAVDLLDSSAKREWAQTGQVTIK